VSPLAKTLTAASLAIAAGCTSAQADILAFGTNINPHAVTGAEAPVPLKTNGAPFITFKTKADNSIVVVTYNAECGVGSDHVGDYLSLRIALNGVIDAQPKAQPLCSALVNSKVEVYTTVSHQAVLRVPKAGEHTIAVHAVLALGATSGRLDDSSIVIED
jgi:hypothetical protein